MRWAVALGLATLALAACRDQREACTKAARSGRLVDEDRWIERCVAEKWSDREIDCMVRSGDGFLGMFCED